MAEGADHDSTERCFICDKHRLGDRAEGGVLFEDELLYVGHVHTMGRGVAYRGWFVVEPKRHAAGLGLLTDDEAGALGLLLNRIARILRDELGAVHVYAFVFGDAVPHLHVHVAPRYPDTPREYWGPRLNQWADAPRVNAEEIRDLVSHLRSQLSNRP